MYGSPPFVFCQIVGEPGKIQYASGQGDIFLSDIPQAHNGFPFVFRQIIGEPGKIQYASGQGDIFLGDIPQIHDSPPFTYRESVGEPKENIVMSWGKETSS